MIFLKLSMPFALYHFTSVIFPSVAAIQQVSGSNVTLGSSNLTIPPLIPGIRFPLHFDPKPTLILHEVYSNTMELLYYLAIKPWDEPLTREIAITGHGYASQIVIGPWPETQSRLQVKHGIVGLFWAGVSIVRREIAVRDHEVPGVHVRLFLYDQPLGYLEWLHSGANGTLSLIDAGHATSAVQIARRDQGTDVAVGSEGVIVDPQDSRFKVKYQIGDHEADYSHVFMAFVEALATAAPNDASAVGDSMEGRSFHGEIVLKVRGVGTPSTLSWGRMFKPLLLVWSHVISQHNSSEVGFELLYDEVKIGIGFILNATGPGN